ncbi:MAG TPA: MATE family efflux transporter [Alphaproteobacteria bacterium]|nr:MATE family efflux transporter [Alphaproteobacteria bacterium]
MSRIGDHHPWRSELRATLTLAWPLAGSQLAQIAMQTTDVIMIGWLGPEALAAAALGSGLIFLPFVVCLGLAFATQPMIAQAVGRRHAMVRDVRRSVRQGLWAIVALAAPMLAALWESAALLGALGQDPAIAAAAESYVRAMIWGIVPMLWFMVLRGFAAALGRPNAGLWVTLIVVVTNAFGNWILIFGNLGAPALGIVGAGMSSAVSGWLSFALMLAYIQRDRRTRRFALLGRFWRPDWSRFCEIFRLGLPIGSTLTLEVGLFVAAVMLMGLIGADALAAHQIAIQVASITFMVPLGLAQAATIRVGMFVGAGDAEGVRRAGWTAAALAGAFMAIMALGMWTLPRLVVSIFVELANPDNAPVVELAVAILAVAALFQIFDGLQAVGQGALRGLKDTRVPMLIAAFGYWGVGFPTSVVLGFAVGLEGVGIWLGLALGLAAVAGLALTRFARRDRLLLAGQGALTSPA